MKSAFDEWFKDKIGVEERSAFYGWQACADEYQRELNMMETRAIDAEKARDVEHRLWEAVDREGYTLRAIIDEARKQVTGCECPICKGLLSVLDRSGARGGSVKVKLTHSGPLEMKPVSDEDCE